VQSLLQQVDVGCEVLIEIRILAEIDYEDFIVGIAGANQIEHCLIHFVALLAHRTGIINHNTHCHRHVILME